MKPGAPAPGRGRQRRSVRRAEQRGDRRHRTRSRAGSQKATSVHDHGNAPFNLGTDTSLIAGITTELVEIVNSMMLSCRRDGDDHFADAGAEGSTERYRPAVQRASPCLAPGQAMVYQTRNRKGVGM